MGEHDIDVVTSYCKSCGKGLTHIVEEELPCIKADNVIAISHTISRRRLDKLTEKILQNVCTPDKDNDPTAS